MRVFGWRVLLGFPAALWLALFAGPVSMAATTYAITATNVTIGSSGTGTTNFTVSGIPMTGILTVTCSAPTTTAHIPTCDTSDALFALPVDEGQTITGSFTFYPYNYRPPVTTGRGGYAWPAGGVVAAGLLIGLRFRRRAPRWLLCILLAAASLAGSMALSGCGGGNGMTPGTYTYTLTAGDSAEMNPLTAAATTTISVTVP